ncbi:hypothetical protein PQR67_26970 [Paraburkholderia fungorum]|uniref:hypothetical protein n=1 Tax=Paraburkholderia fungorum TaxID=134537 RepID=UPI0038BB99B8
MIESNIPSPFVSLCVKDMRHAARESSISYLMKSSNSILIIEYNFYHLRKLRMSRLCRCRTVSATSMLDVAAARAIPLALQRLQAAQPRSARHGNGTAIAKNAT